MTTNYSLFRMLSLFFSWSLDSNYFKHFDVCYTPVSDSMFFLKGEISTEVTVSNSKSSSNFNYRGQFKKNQYDSEYLIKKRLSEITSSLREPLIDTQQICS